MRFFRMNAAFAEAEDGAVTVDWVVLTAAVVGIGVAALSAIRQATGNLTSQITAHMNNQSITSTF